MANNVTLINRRPVKSKKVLHNGDIVIIRSKQYLVTSVVYPSETRVKVAEKRALCSIISIRSGNPLFSRGIARSVGVEELVGRVNSLLGAIRDGSHAHRNRYELQDITEKDVRIIPKDAYDIVIEKL